jgi:hypothetical protein
MMEFPGTPDAQTPPHAKGATTLMSGVEPSQPVRPVAKPLEVLTVDFSTGLLYPFLGLEYLFLD